MERSVLLEARGFAWRSTGMLKNAAYNKVAAIKTSAVVLNLSNDWDAFAIHLKEEPALLAKEFGDLLTHRSQSLGNSIGIRISATFETMDRSAKGLPEDHCLSSVLHVGRSGKVASVQLQEVARLHGGWREACEKYRCKVAAVVRKLAIVTHRTRTAGPLSGSDHSRSALLGRGGGEGRPDPLIFSFQ
jgi:hypothetical protein